MNDISNEESILPTNNNTNTTSSITLWEEVAVILSALIGGGRYGLKIRLPHATIMTFLFGSKLSFHEKIKTIVKLATEHATNLAAFACVYKFMLSSLKVLSKQINQGYDTDTIHYGVLRQLSKSLLSIIINGPYYQRKRHMTPITTNPSKPGLPEQPYHAFLAGSVGGYLVWGNYSSINYQLLLYLASRIIIGCIKLAREKGVPPFSWKGLTFNKTYPLAAAGIWGTVMMLFEEYPDVLHPSLKRSMDEIYRFSFGADKSQS